MTIINCIPSLGKPVSDYIKQFLPNLRIERIAAFIKYSNDRLNEAEKD